MCVLKYKYIVLHSVAQITQVVYRNTLMNDNFNKYMIRFNIYFCLTPSTIGKIVLVVSVKRGCLSPALSFSKVGLFISSADFLLSKMVRWFPSTKCIDTAFWQYCNKYHYNFRFSLLHF